MMTEAQRQAVEAVEKHGSQVAAARALGVPITTIKRRMERARKWLGLDNGVAVALSDVGIADPGIVRGGWLKTKEASIQFRMPDTSTDDVLERVRDAFADIPPAPAIDAPAVECDDLLTLYPLADVHMGMMAWGRETGEEYNTRLAEERLVTGMASCVGAAPESAQAVVLVLGDLLHANDQTNQTPVSKHQLDVDTRHMRTLEIAIRAIAAVVEMAAKKHREVTVAFTPGNHDPAAYMAVMFALAERYRNSPRVDVQKRPGEFFAMDFGRNMFLGHHGDRAKAERLVMFMADEYPEMWGRTRHRFLFTGHLHHGRVQDIGGVQVEQLRAVTARDAYAVGHAYTARAQMQAVTFHRDRGEVSRVKVAL